MQDVVDQALQNAVGQLGAELAMLRVEVATLRAVNAALTEAAEQPEQTGKES